MKVFKNSKLSISFSLLLMLITFNSCIPEQESEIRLVKNVINNTDKTIVNFIKTEEGEEVFTINAHKSSSVTFVKKRITDRRIIWHYGSSEIFPIAVFEDIIYNIEDTTRLSYFQEENKEYDIYGFFFDTDTSEKNRVLKEHINISRGSMVEFIKEDTIEINISDSLILIMTNDSNIVEFFPEFYD